MREVFIFLILITLSFSYSLEDVRVNLLLPEEKSNYFLHNISSSSYNATILFVKNNKPLFVFLSYNRSLNAEQNLTKIRQILLESLITSYNFTKTKQNLLQQIEMLKDSLQRPYSYKHSTFKVDNPLYSCPESFDLKRDSNYSPCNDLEECKKYFIVYCMQRGCDAGLYASAMFKYVQYLGLFEANVSLFTSKVLSLQFDDKKLLLDDGLALLKNFNQINETLDILSRNRLRLPDAKVPLDECPNCAGVCSIIPINYSALQNIYQILYAFEDIEKKLNLYTNSIELGLSRIKLYEKRMKSDELMLRWKTLQTSINDSLVETGCELVSLKLDDDQISKSCSSFYQNKNFVLRSIEDADEDFFNQSIYMLMKDYEFLKQTLTKLLTKIDVLKKGISEIRNNPYTQKLLFLKYRLGYKDEEVEHFYSTWYELARFDTQSSKYTLNALESLETNLNYIKLTQMKLVNKIRQESWNNILISSFLVIFSFILVLSIDKILKMFKFNISRALLLSLRLVLVLSIIFLLVRIADAYTLYQYLQ
ncbi:MAG: hypothetical protein N3E37_02365 [Candidatus Micrarchaeota archaeon]|nr:hypothetical protein [Candidatus Micrarchaeota archaeon]